MKKLFSLFVALLCLVAVNAKTIYLNAGGGNLWDQGGAVFFAHSWQGTDTNPVDVQMGTVAAGVYSASVPDANDKVLFVRMPNGSTSLNWDTKWNQTDDLTIPAGMDCFTITGWGEGEGAKSVGTWSAYDGPTTIEYYLAGEGFPNASWTEGQHLLMTDGTISFTNLPAGTYRFKVTNNTVRDLNNITMRFSQVNNGSGTTYSNYDSYFVVDGNKNSYKIENFPINKGETREMSIMVKNFFKTTPRALNATIVMSCENYTFASPNLYVTSVKIPDDIK